MGELPPLRAAAEQNGSTDFTPLWLGQAAALAREMPAKLLTDMSGSHQVWGTAAA
jgi:nitronate monooxygenase